MSNPDIISLYSRGQHGGDLPYFVGKQYGSGWLRTLARIAFPILKRFGKVAVNTANDVIMNDQKILPSLRTHAVNEVNDVLPEVSSILKGKGTKRAKTLINKRMKRTIFKR